MFVFINVVGVIATLAVFTTLAFYRYPGRADRVGIALVAAAAMAVLWPVTLWVGVGLWLRGLATPRLDKQQYEQLQAYVMDASTYAQRAAAAHDNHAATYWSGEAARANRELSRW